MIKICNLPGCSRQAGIKGVCARHYQQAKNGYIVIKGIDPNPKCSVDHCEKPSYSKKAGVCKTHYYQIKAGGVPGGKRRYGKPDGLICEHSSCVNEQYCRGFCRWHYAQINQGFPITDIPHLGYFICKYKSCDTRSYKSEYCSTHRKQFSRTGRMWVIGDKFEGLGRPERVRLDDCEFKGCSSERSARTILCKRHNEARRRHKLSIDRYMEIYEDPRCASCGSVDRLCLDHDHSHCGGISGCEECVRGLLCSSCNSALGLLQESPNRIQKLLEYSMKWRKH